MGWEFEATKADAIIARFEKVAEPTLEDVLTQLKLAARAYHDSLGLVARTAAILDQKLERAAEEDALLDKTVDDAAAAFIGAHFTTRRKPFGTFSSYAPWKLTQLKMGREVQEVQSLVTKAAEANPPEPVVKVLADLLRQASQVRMSLDDLTGPQVDADEASKARSAASLDLKRALRKLRLRAELVWPDDVRKLKDLFADPQVIQDQVLRKRKSSEAKKPATPSEPETP